jgi:hypothetical protein
MKVISTDKLGKIQEKFHELFPGLQLKFYSEPHRDYAGSNKSTELPSDTTLGDLVKGDTSLDFDFLSDMSVRDLEHLFEEKWGLHAQVFRKSNNLWLQTSKTDDWTLGEQNRKGLHSMGITDL